MKTLIINGSPRRKGDTEALINAFTKSLVGEVLILSHHDGISPCVDCRHCWQKPGCAIGDMEKAYPFFEDCDNLTIASPVWFSDLSGITLNLASRLIQPYFAARRFRKAEVHIKKKRGVLLLAGAEKGTETRAAQTAHTLFKQMNTLPLVAEVFSMNTDALPARLDSEALEKAARAAELLNRLGGF